MSDSAAALDWSAGGLSWYFKYMTLLECSALLFDMDGVLIDSTPAVTRVWSGWALEHGLDPEDVVRRAHGRPSIMTVRELLPNADYLLENSEVERREIADVAGVVPLHGAMELLRSLPANHWAIVTSCTAALAKVRINAGGLPSAKFLVTADDIKCGKPNPEPYLKGAELLDVPASQCIVVEDAPAGVRAGKSAGARVIALATTTSFLELRDAGADWIVKDCAAIFVKAVNGELSIELHELNLHGNTC